MLAGFQHQLGRADDHLGRIQQRLLPGQAAGHTAVGQGLQEQIAERAAAACHRRAGVQHGFRQPVQETAGSQNGAEVLDLLLGHLVVGGIEDHTLANGRRGIGHNPQNRIVLPHHLRQRFQPQTRRHADEDKPVLPGRQHRGNFFQNTGHHLGFDPQENPLGVLGHLAVGGGHLTAQPLGQHLRLGGGAVGQQNGRRVYRFTGGFHQGPRHISSADESQLIHTIALPYRICPLPRMIYL